MGMQAVSGFGCYNSAVLNNLVRVWDEHRQIFVLGVSLGVELLESQGFALIDSAN